MVNVAKPEAGAFRSRLDIVGLSGTCLFSPGLFRLFAFRFLGNRLPSLASVPRRIERLDQTIF